jgi:DNA replication protein DnaC
MTADAVTDNLPHCPTCRDSRVLLVRGTDPEELEPISRVRLCDCVGRCPECGGDRYVPRTNDDGYDVDYPCSTCYPAEQRVYFWNAARVPQRYEGATVENYEPATPSQFGALQRCREWLAGYRPKREGMLLVGPTGTGKTHLVTGIIRELTSRRVKCWFVRSRDLLEGLRSRARRNETADDDLTASQYRLRLIRVPVLVLDELAALATPWQREVMSDVLESRYNARATTLVTSNMTPDEAEDLFGEAGRRVTSRLIEMAPLVVVFGEDYRQRKGVP